MENIIAIEINKNKYYSSTDLENISPIFFKGCRSARELIKKKTIDNKNFIYGRSTKNVWKKTDGDNKRLDKVLFTVAWAKSTIPELARNNEIKHDIEEAPPIIILDDLQKFRDDEDNIIDIKVRGEREFDKCYFSVSDVAIEFDMPSLHTTLLGKDNYKELKHYKFFNCKICSTGKKSVIKKILYLTYTGLLRVLFVSRSGTADNFVEWASKTLFTLQMGTDDQKDKLISQVKGVSYETIQELFSVNARSMPCVYLTHMATVKNVRDIMDIDDKYADTDVVYKFGLTKDFEARKNGHKSEYKELAGSIDMTLVSFSFIDPLYINKAETELKGLLSDYLIEYKKYKELIIASPSIFKFIKEIYEKLAMKYSGHSESFRIESSKLEGQMKQMHFDNVLEKEKIQREFKEREHQLIIDKKDLQRQVEVGDLKLQISELKQKKNYSK
jgi:hypothetical protein